MLRGQERLLLALAFLGDLFEDLADPGGLMSFSYRQVYGFIPQKYKKHNFYMAVRNSFRVGNIEKVVGRGGPYLRLTGRGKKEMARRFPIFSLQRKKWDKKWRIVFFDIEEVNKKMREKFREKLYELGFGQLQKSVYLSPFPIEKEMREFIEALGLSKKAYLLVSPNLLAGDEKVLAEKVWKLQKINKEYRKIWEEIKRIDKNKLKEIREIGSRFLEILADDPLLPQELLPQDWLGIKIRKPIFQLLKRL